MTLRDDEPLVYTVEEAAERLRTGRSATYEAIRRGQIPSVRIGRKIRIPRAALEALLNAGAALERTAAVVPTTTHDAAKQRGGP